MSPEDAPQTPGAPDAEPRVSPSRPTVTPGAMDDYHKVADTVGFVPNIRKSDNLMQLAAAGLGAVLGGVAGIGAGGLRPGPILLGAVLGVFVFVILSGIVLMVLGWVRTAKGSPASRGLCPRCGFDLLGLEDGGTCPECGRRY